MGNKWATIASHLPGRTDNEIKNHWNTRLRKRLAHIAFDNIFHNMHRYGLQRSLASTIQNPYRQLMGSTSIPTASFSLTHSPLNGGDSRDKLCKRACDGNVPDSNYTQARSFRPSLADDFFVTHIAQWERARLEAEALSPRLSNDLSVCPQRPFPIEQASDRDEKNSSMDRQSFHAHEGNGTSYPQHKDKLHDTSCTAVTGGVVDAGSKRPDQGTKRRRTQGNDENLQNLFPKEVLVEMCPLTHSFDCHDDMQKTLATHCNDDLEKTLATNSVDDLTTVSSPTMCSDSLFSLWYYLEHGYPLSPSRSCSLESSSG
ncbi:hypothetical protein KP509_16G064900 [Ceratopteris richardii]|nr:hypothetical protein KP509_16G064900 [Ceratopteris richardii]